MKTNTKIAVAFVAALGSSAVRSVHAEEAPSAPVPAARRDPAGRDEVQIEKEKQQAHFVSVGSVSEIKEKWSPTSNLFVRGPLKELDDKRLEELAKWLRGRPNWVVYLANGDKGESYTDMTGRSHRGSDAVEFYLGQVLAGNSQFAETRDQRTGKANGAILYVYLSSARGGSSVGIRTAEAYDEIGYGEANWAGNLERHALDPLKDGRRVYDAVVNTITAIDTGLNNSITSAEQKAWQLHRDAYIAKNSLAQNFVSYEAAIAKGIAEHPGVLGDLFHPDFEPLKQSLEQCAKSYQEGKYSDVMQLASATNNKLDLLKELLAKYPTTKNQLQLLDQKIAALKTNQFIEQAQDELSQAEKSSKQARESWQAGDSGFWSKLTNAESDARKLEGVLVSARRWDTTKDVFSWTLLIGSILGALGFATSKRRSTQRAKNDFENLEQATNRMFEKRVEGFIELEGRREEILGDAEAAAKLTGVTKSKADECIANIDSIYILNAAAQDLLQVARSRAKVGGLLRAFNPQPYREALSVLKFQKVSFNPEDRVSRLFTGLKEGAGALWAKAEQYLPFSLSFDDLHKEFTRRVDAAKTALISIENATSLANRRLAYFEESAASIVKQASNLKPEQKIPVLAQVFEPAFRKEVATLRQIAKTDPIQVEGELAVLDAKYSAVEKLAASVFALEEGKLFEKLRSAESKLNSLGVETAWISAAEQNISKQLASDITAISQGKKPTAIDPGQKYLELFELVDRALVIAQRGVMEFPERAERLDQNVKRARKEIADKLGLASESVLNEEDQNPVVILDQAKVKKFEALKLLNAGKIEEATDLMDQSYRKLDQGLQYTLASEHSLASYTSVKLQLESKHAELTVQMRAVSSALERIRANFNSDVMKLGEGDEAHPNENGTISDNLAEVQENLRDAAKILRAAEIDFKNARLLEAGATLQQAKAKLQLAGAREQEVIEKEQRLENQVKLNSNKLVDLETLRHMLSNERIDPRTTRMTIVFADVLDRSLAAVRQSHEQPLSNPFLVATELERVGAKLEELKRKIGIDRKNYAEVTRSYDVAQAMLQEAFKAHTQAANDPVPDSDRIIRSQAKLEELANELSRLGEELRPSGQDWLELDQRIDRAYEAITHEMSVIRDEEEKGIKAFEAVRSAKSSVNEAANWSGRYSVQIDGSPGSSASARARQLLEAGDYEEAERYASQAISEARSAIDYAERLVQQRYREEQARIKREREAREAAERAARAAAAARSRNSYGGGFGGGGFGSSGFGGGGSGFSSSRF